jgi:tRNA A-37 threonylcarbamoyl transferase component Bud32
MIDTEALMRPPEAPPADLASTSLLPDSANLTIAPVTLGDYELIAELGRGAMGVVYKARQKSLGRIVALKMVLTSQTAPTSLARFDQEARSAAALDHPGIVPLFDFGDVQGQPYYTMAFIEGDSLTGLVKRQGPLPPRQAADLLARVADAVAYAHQRGILHRDLKPDNILVDAQGHPRITDFGLARRMEDGPNLTTAGSIMGTPSYMAPEQAQGLTELSRAVDVYSLGAVLHAMLVGQSPFTGSSVYEVLLKVGQEPPVPLRQINPELPEALERIVLRCLEKDPAKRYACAADLATELRGWLQSDRAPTAQVAHAPAPRSWRARALALAGVLLLVVGTAAAVVWRRGQSSAATTGPGAARADETEEPVLVSPWNKPTRQEFDLKVSLPGLAADRKGTYRMQDGKPIRIRIESPHDIYVGVWSVQADKVVQLFPNEHEGDQLVRAGVPRLVPGNETWDIAPEAAEGVEYLRVVASTVRWSPLSGKPLGPFAFFEGKDRQRWEIHQRGIGQGPDVDASPWVGLPGAWEVAPSGPRGLSVRPRVKSSSPGRVAEVVLPYRVGPRPPARKTLSGVK